MLERGICIPVRQDLVVRRYRDEIDELLSHRALAQDFRQDIGGMSPCPFRVDHELDVDAVIVEDQLTDLPTRTPR